MLKKFIFLVLLIFTSLMAIGQIPLDSIDIEMRKQFREKIGMKVTYNRQHVGYPFYGPFRRDTIDRSKIAARKR